MTKIEALELALTHVRGYQDRMFLQFLINVEKRKMKTVAQMVDEIRDWEMDAGESFTDYFLDRYSYCGTWLEFLESKGYHDLAQEIRDDGYILSNGEKLSCTDQQLKFEPHNTAHENAGGQWDEDEYRKDVALWAEFILADAAILKDYEEFMKE